MCPSSPGETREQDQPPIPEGVLNAATDAFGSEAMHYLDAPNYALGGRSPRELLMRMDGQRIVLNEIQAHLGGGPI